MDTEQKINLLRDRYTARAQLCGVSIDDALLFASGFIAACRAHGIQDDKEIAALGDRLVAERNLPAHVEGLLVAGLLAAFSEKAIGKLLS